MQSLINYFIKFPIAANLCMFGLLILGVVGLFNMKSTYFPERPSRNINVQVVYPGASPEEIEEGIINKIEENLKGVTGVERVTSVSSENAGTVNVEVLRGYDTDLIVQDVKNAVDRISSFPDGMEPPVVYKLENLSTSITFAVSGEIELKVLKERARKVEEDLLAMNGISKVSLSGFPDEEIEIAFREQDLRTYDLTFAQATAAVRAANLEITGGTVKGDDEELLVRARNKAYYAEGLQNIVVKTSVNGGVVRLYQIADIKDKWADNPNRSYLNGASSIVVTVQNTLEEDLLTITDLVKDYIDKFNSENRQVKATVINDQSIVLNQRINLLTENGIIGFLIVVVLLAMFLHWRLAFWVAIAIPISFGGMFLVASLIDVTINVISLFGMILVIGILVDDGIVIGESIYQKHEKGVPPLKAALEGTMEVLPAVFAAIITTVIAFSTFFFIDGRLGDFFREMAIVVIFSLIFSLVEGAIILPTHVAHSKALSPDRKTNKVQEWFENIMGWLRDKTYAPVLAFCMKYKLFTVAAFVGLLIISFAAFGGIVKTTFFPVIERDNATINLQMPAGTPEEQTQKWLDHIEASIWKANDKLSEQYFNNEKEAILRVEKRVGPSTYEGLINVAVLDGESRDSLRMRAVLNAIRTTTGPIIEAELVTYGQRAAFGKPVSVSMIGSDLEELSSAVEEVKMELTNLSELTDVIDNNQAGLREINISLKDKALYLGLNLQEVVAQVRQGFFGSEVQRLQRGRDEVKVWVRYSEEDRSDITKLMDMRVRFIDGREFPLSEIADLKIERGIININHLDGKREIKVEADISNDDVSISDITTNLKEAILPSILPKYPTVEARFEGQNREQEKTNISMQKIGPVILALMFFMIALTFRSISQTVSVFLLIPFSMIGVIWGHWLMGTPFSLFSALGFIALVGVLVNDSLVLVTTYNRYLQEGMSQMEAIHKAGVSRFRPIVLTTFTTFAGLAPLLFEKSFQAQFLIPMAIAVAFGLLAVTVVNLLLLPVLLIMGNRFKVYASALWTGEKPDYAAVEGAVRKDSNYEFLYYVFLAFIGLVIAFIVIGPQLGLF
ncbi:MAG: efflux RND transporter permease subunit [Bacteroidota bacterium]